LWRIFCQITSWQSNLNEEDTDDEISGVIWLFRIWGSVVPLELCFLHRLSAGGKFHNSQLNLPPRHFVPPLNDMRILRSVSHIPIVQGGG
ncbi:MAG: hypothetical protein KA886_08965, partial [Candidatus Cloacimonetes bacterium]|nr:hypothetical protein [Candidatus Cloacimonadota bacterium]